MKRLYTFDCTLMATVTVKAETRAEARSILGDVLDCASVNAGELPNGDALIFEASLDGPLDYVESCAAEHVPMKKVQA
jgi:hypothetical protein